MANQRNKNLKFKYLIEEVDSVEEKRGVKSEIRRCTSKYYIAYFDILGYKKFFEDNENDVNQFLNENIRIVDEIVEKIAHNRYVFCYDFEIKLFSDNFAIFVKDSPKIGEYSFLKVLSYIIAELQLNFLINYKILIRGAITKGEAYIDDRIVFGEGIVRVNFLEHKATFPRIILDKERFDEMNCESLCGKFVDKDADGEYYVDFLSCNDYIESANEKQEKLMLLRNSIMTLVEKYGKYDRNFIDKNTLEVTEKNIAKYSWLLTKYNNHCGVKYKSYSIPFEIKLFQPVMKYEIEIN